MWLAGKEGMENKIETTTGFKGLGGGNEGMEKRMEIAPGVT